MIGAWLRRLFGMAETPEQLRQRAGILRDRGIALMVRAKVCRQLADSYDAHADDLEFGLRARSPRDGNPDRAQGP